MGVEEGSRFSLGGEPPEDEPMDVDLPPEEHPMDVDVSSEPRDGQEEFEGAFDLMDLAPFSENPVSVFIVDFGAIS